MEKCQIHEFSRKFLEPKWSDKLNQYVTTGFEREIGWETREVPKQIANAVQNNAFRINDNYPPPKGEIALLAREIDKYAVLAVATGLVDDGDRPLVAYRYFWLEKPPRNNMIDGIGTLLKWWIKQDYPCFEFPIFIEQEVKNLHDTLFLPKLDLIKKYYLEFQSLLQDIPINSNDFPISFDVPHQYFKEYEKFHSLALLLNKEYNLPISWAFNVDQLETPAQFALIYSTADLANELIINCVNSLRYFQKLDLPSSQTIVSGSFGDVSFEQLPEESANISEEISTDSQLKQCLIEIARNINVDSNFWKLANYLNEIDSYTWNWTSILDKIILNNHREIASARYKALLAILKPPPEILRWLSWLKRKRNRRYWQEGINLQNAFIEFLDSEEFLNNNKLDSHLYQIILELLRVNSLSKEREWLLIKSESFWQSYFKNYTQMLFYQISFQRFNIQSLLPENKIDYELIARLFAQVESYSLAAFFYQLCWGEVPADIYTKAEIMIIPLQKSSRSSGLITLAISNLKQDIKLLLVNLISIFKSHDRQGIQAGQTHLIVRN